MSELLSRNLDDGLEGEMVMDSPAPPAVAEVPHMKAIVSEDQRSLERIKILFSAMKDIDETMPIQLAITFLEVAIHEGCSLTDIWKKTGWSQSTLSRHLLDLGERDRHKNPGLQLIESRRDPAELRKNIYTLTPKGRKLAQRLLSLLRM